MIYKIKIHHNRESTASQYFSGLLVSHNNKIKKMYKQRANDRINIFKMKEKKKRKLVSNE